MRDKSGSTIGWVLLDIDRKELPGNKIVCAAIGFSEIAAYGRVRGYDYTNEEMVDILALQAGEPGSYFRIGRGRVVRKGWLEACTEEKVVVS